MSHTPNHPWQHRFALLTALATLALLGLGGLVTSHGVGLAVPDWPNTYGYNLFFFPVSQWVGGVFYEHTHRLAASLVGLLTTVLALWFYGRTARPFLRWAGGLLLLAALVTAVAWPRHRTDAAVLALAGSAACAAGLVWPRCEPAPRWLRRLGLLAFVGVVVQGVLGGLRVVLFKDQLGIVHATVAQLFFVLICSLALVTSSWWQRTSAPLSLRAPSSGAPAGLVPVLLVATGLILGQLVLGATMRHQHAGLAIPDFPLAYGKLWPAMDADSVTRYNQHRLEVTALNPITATQIGLQMVHRLMALLVLGAVAAAAGLARRQLGPKHVLSRLTLAWFGLIVLQAGLGAATIWSNKAADVATAHVLVGALSLALGGLLSLVSVRELLAARRHSALPEASPSFAPLGFRARPSTAGLE